MKIISWNCNGDKRTRDTILSLLRTYQPEYLFLQNYREQSFNIPNWVDAGLPIDPDYSLGNQYQFSWKQKDLRNSPVTAQFVHYKWKVENEVSLTGDRYSELIEGHMRLMTSGRLGTAFGLDYVIVFVNPPRGSRNPKSRRAIARRDFDNDLLRLVVAYRKFKPVILVGDLKIASEDIDLHPSLRPPLERYIGLRIDPTLRQQFLSYRLAGLDDALRLFSTHDDLYSHWSGHKNPKARYSNRDLNRGWRSDYFLVDRNIKHLVTSCSILTDVFGSRNAPILMDISVGRSLPPRPKPPPPDNPELPPDEIYWDNPDWEDPDWEDTGGYSSTYDYNPYIP